MIYTLGADVSRYQGQLDFSRLYADGVRFIIPKVAQSGVLDPTWTRNITEARKAGILVVAGYAFLTAGDTDIIIERTVDFLDGIPLALDYETNGLPATIADRWVKKYEDIESREGLGYYGLYPPAPVSDMFSYWPRWFPQYPGNDSPPRLPFWDGSSLVVDWRKQCLIHQYTGTGRLPGIIPQIDLNHLACELVELEEWVETGTGIWEVRKDPSPIPPPVHTDTFHLGIRLIHLNTTGNDVVELQTLLNKAGAKLVVDGDDGAATDAAVRAFQRTHALSVDGWVGPATLAALQKYA